MADVFISYSRESRDLTRSLAKDLESKGYSVWWDTELVPGDRFHEVIYQELEAARVVIVIWTLESVTSDWVISEATYAHGARKLIPLRVPKLEQNRIPMPFGVIHTGIIENNIDTFHKLRINVKEISRKNELSFLKWIFLGIILIMIPSGILSLVLSFIYNEFILNLFYKISNNIDPEKFDKDILSVYSEGIVLIYLGLGGVITLLGLVAAYEKNKFEQIVPKLIIVGPIYCTIIITVMVSITLIFSLFLS